MGRLCGISLVILLQIGAPSLAADNIPFQTLQAYLDTDTSRKVDTEAFTSYLYQLEKKRGSFKNEHDFLRFVFHKTHQKFLKHYEAYASFSDLLQKGKYNCLTGTALYSIVLDHFNINYSTIETNYHIFILAKADGVPVLLEATDPLSGFVENEKELATKLETYRDNSLVKNSASKDQVHYEFRFNLWETVSLQELTGLLYFNQAIKSFNERRLEEATSFLSKAAQFRPSERMEEFSSIVMAMVNESELRTAVKKQLLVQLNEVKKRSTLEMSASLH
jgi:hypothetical protein